MDLEAFLEDRIKKAIGAVTPKSDISDKHIQNVIQYLIQHGKSKQELEAAIQDAISKHKELEGKSKILYSAIVKNMPEQHLRGIFTKENIPPPEGCDTFNVLTFMKLVRFVQAENKSMFPLRNFVDRKNLKAPRFIIVPTNIETDKKFNRIETAAVTPQGEFIFNSKCMQDDMSFFYAQGIIPKGKKYKSNGGPFPDEWAPVEFTILHEFFHYTHGDFHYAKILGGNPKIHNWAQDFRSNYDLIKAGHHPYAEGLFSDYVHYDNYYSYKEMYEAVLEEFKKLNKDQQKKVENALEEKGASDHGEHDGEKQDTIDDLDEPSEKDLEEHGKNVSKKAGEKQDKQDLSKEKEEEEKRAKEKAKQGSRGHGEGEAQKVDISQIRPKYNWKQLLARLIHSASKETVTTFQKMHKRSAINVHLAAQLGAAAIRPGEKITEPNILKICLVIDVSGSMSSTIPIVFAEIFKLLTNKNVSSEKRINSIIVNTFSTNYEFYNCIISGKGGTAHKLSDINKLTSRDVSAGIDLITLLTTHTGGSTNFTNSLKTKLSTLIKKGYNVLIFTDTDLIADTDNLKEFVDLSNENRSHVYLLLDSQSSFNQAVKQLGHTSHNMSHL